MIKTGKDVLIRAAAESCSPRLVKYLKAKECFPIFFKVDNPLESHSEPGLPSSLGFLSNLLTVSLSICKSP